MRTREMCLTALVTALLCAIAPIAIPAGPVPVSLATLAVYLAGALLGARRGALAVGLYLLIGAAGLPVFSGFQGGLHRLAGVTGGYLAGYLPCAWIVGFCTEREGGRDWIRPASMLAGTACCYAVGTAWFVLQTQLGAAETLATCVLPFLPGDLLKIAAASAASGVLKRRMPALYGAR